MTARRITLNPGELYRRPPPSTSRQPSSPQSSPDNIPVIPANDVIVGGMGELPKPKRVYQRSGKFTKVAKAQRSIAYKNRVCQDIQEENKEMMIKAEKIRKIVLGVSGRYVSIMRKKGVPIRLHTSGVMQGAAKLEPEKIRSLKEFSRAGIKKSSKKKESRFLFNKKQFWGAKRMKGQLGWYASIRQ